jgi:2-polyprenyl-6-methoxyphenol hydroxylase-like FAD-dependent oxidoreductase
MAAHPHRREHDPRGWLATGKMVIYPIAATWTAKDASSSTGWPRSRRRQHTTRDWNRRGRARDFIGAFADWNFDWLDVPGDDRGAESILEFPMVDQEPLPFWTQGRVTLLGDAAHPMYPRGSNGAGQAILDARALADALALARHARGRARELRVATPARHRERRAHEPHQPAGRDPARSVAAHRRQAVPARSTTSCRRDELVALSDGYNASPAWPPRRARRQTRENRVPLVVRRDARPCGMPHRAEPYPSRP